MTAVARHVVAGHPTVVKLGRVGWFAKGIVYVLAGVLALAVVTKSFGWTTGTTGAKEASPTGAIKEVAGTSGGPLLLVVLAIGMLLYAAWRLVSALLPGEPDAESLAQRIGYVVSAVIYTTLAVTAISLARTPTAKANGNSTVTDMTSKYMSNSFGRWMIGFVGVVVIAAGLFHIVTGLKGDVTKDIDMHGMASERARWTRRLGSIGEIGRGVAIGLIGFFLVRAAVTYDAAQATGLDGALRRLAAQRWGALVVGVIGVGLVAYGVFCLGTFNRRRLQAP